MKFTVLAGDIAEATRTAVESVDLKTRFHALHMFCLMAEPGHLHVAAHNLDQCVTIKVAAEVTEPGAVLVDGHRFASLVAGLPGTASVTAATDGEEVLKINAARGRYCVATLPVEKFPVILVPDAERAVEIPLGDDAIKRLFKMPLATAAREKTRYYLIGINLHAAESGVVAVATDGHRLIRTVTAATDAVLLDRDIIIPRDSCARIVRLGGDLLRTDGQIVEIVNAKRGITFASKLIDATYPAYEQTIPAPSPNGITVDRKALADALTRIETFRGTDFDGQGKRMWKPLAVSWTDASVLTLTLPNTDQRGAVEEIDATTSGTARFGCRPDYLLSIISAVDCETVSIDHGGPGAMVRITAQTDEGFLGMMGPMYLPAEEEITA